MAIANSLVVSMTVLRLAGFAYQGQDGSTTVPGAPPGTPDASVQVLATSPADGLIDVDALAWPTDGRFVPDDAVIPTPSPKPTPTLTPTPDPARFGIEYRITGTATHCSATYETATGGTNQSGVNVPFTYNWNGAKSGDFLYLSCQIDTATDQGDLMVAIYKNGVLYKSATAAAFPSSATASGSY
jgi:hypothetical protein